MNDLAKAQAQVTVHTLATSRERECLPVMPSRTVTSISNTLAESEDRHQ